MLHDVKHLLRFSDRIIFCIKKYNKYCIKEKIYITLECKPKIITMKTSIKTLSILFFTLLLTVGFSACSSDTDPADTEVFVGTYKGSISYTAINPAKHITATDGKVIVSKIGSTYSFHFDHKIPDLTGIKFEKKDDNTYISIGTGIKGITITKDKLTMLVTKGGETWTANCDRD